MAENPQTLLYTVLERLHSRIRGRVRADGKWILEPGDEIDSSLAENLHQHGTPSAAATWNHYQRFGGRLRARTHTRLSGLAMTQPILTPFCNLTTVASSNQHQMSWLIGRPRGTSTSSTETTKTRIIDSFFSGQVGSSTTCNMLTRVSFVFVQLLLLPHGTTINASGDVFEHAPTHGGSGLAMTQPILTPFCNLTTVASSNQHQMSWLIGRPRGTSTSSTETTKTRIIDSFFSGQVGSSTTCNMLTRVSFVFVQLLLLPHGTTINASGDVFEHAPTHGGSGLAMTQPILTPFCNLTTVASSNQHQMSWLIGRPRGTSTSSTETTKTRIIDSFFSGQVGSSTTCNMLTRVSFVFVQLLLLPHGTTINASRDVFEHAPTHGGSGLAMTQPILTPFCNLTTVASSNQHQMSWLIGRPRGTSTSSTETTKTRIIDSFFSGQVGSSTTCNMLTRVSFVFVQELVGQRRSGAAPSQWRWFQHMLAVLCHRPMAQAQNYGVDTHDSSLEDEQQDDNGGSDQENGDADLPDDSLSGDTPLERASCVRNERTPSAKQPRSKAGEMRDLLKELHDRNAKPCARKPSCSGSTKKKC
ncbi:programmed cell death 6-interacting protein-like [Ixodes scapularis]